MGFSASDLECGDLDMAIFAGIPSHNVLLSLLLPWHQHVPANCFMLYLPPKSITMVLIPWLIVGYIIFSCKLLKSNCSKPSIQNENVLNSSLNNLGSWHSKLKLVNFWSAPFIIIFMFYFPSPHSFILLLKVKFTSPHSFEGISNMYRGPQIFCDQPLLHFSTK